VEKEKLPISCPLDIRVVNKCRWALNMKEHKIMKRNFMVKGKGIPFKGISMLLFLGIIAFVAVIGFSMTACTKADPDTDFEYEPSDDGKGMVITDYKGKNTNVVIPSKIQKLPVVKIEDLTNVNIISVVIPASVKEIGENAFSYFCYDLTSVTFKGKDITIGTEAFKDCKNLEKLEFPDGALKPFKHNEALGILGKNEIRTEHYFYNLGERNWRGERELVFYFNSGTSAFYGCDKLPEQMISKLKSLGFLSPEELRELERKAYSGEL